MRLAIAAILLFPILTAANGAAMTAEEFLLRAAEDNIADVEAGRMAQSTDTVPPPVQQLGRRISSDALQINGRLSKLADQRGVHIANQIPPGDRLALERLSKLQGPAFTREYLGYVLADLDHDRGLYQVASGLDDPTVAQFAKDTLTQIETELQMARALYDSQVASAPRLRGGDPQRAE